MDTLKNFLFGMKAFPSLFLFFALREKLGLNGAASLACVYATLYTLAALGAERITKLDYAVVCFWGCGLLVSLANPALGQGYLSQNFTTFFYLFLFLAAYLPLVLHAEPFTMAFAKRQTAKGLWQTEQFQTINRLMTIGWSLLFLTCLLLTLAPGIWTQVIGPIALSIVVGIPFTKKFPGWYLRSHDLTPGRSESKPDALPVNPQPGVAPVQAGDRRFSEAERQRLAAELGPVRKAVVVFGSPRAEKGHTFRMLEYFLQGMEEAGVEVKTIMLARHTIKPCIGCFGCWIKTPGRCIQQDDMAALSAQTDDADLLIYAQPLYIFSVPGIVKNFLDRRLPRLLPYLVESSNGATTHPHRLDSDRRQRMLVFSVCGFPELGHFDGLLTMFRQLARAGNTPIVGELLRPASESLRFGARLGSKHQAVLDALHEAGRQIGGQGYVGETVERAVSQPLFPNLASFRHSSNRFWDTCLRYAEEKQGNRDLPDLEEYLQKDPGMLFAGMAATFDPGAEPDFVATWQFRVSGSASGSFSLAAREGACLFQEGEAERPDCTIATDWDLWQEIVSGKVSGQQAYLEGRYQAEGDLSLLMRLRELFGR